MNILCIETSHEYGSISLLVGEQTYDIEYTKDSFSHAEKINLMIDEVMQRAKLSLQELDYIAVNGGPGSYTGLRIGVSTAKALCYSLDIPLIALDSFEIMYEAVNNQSKPTVVSYHTRAQEMIICAYDAEGTPSDFEHLNLKESPELPYTQNQWIGSGVDTLLADYSLEHTPHIRPHAKLMPWLAKQYATEKRWVDYRVYEPNYMKKVHITKKQA